jgi:hypothetical protein
MSWQLANGYGRVRGGEVDSGFKHLRLIISCGSAGKSTFNCPVKTKTDSKFEAAQHLLLTALWLLSAANVLEECIKEISSDQSSRLLINRKTQHMKRYIVPMIACAANSIKEISKDLAPIPSVNYVHCRMEVKRKSDVVDESSNSRLSPDLQLICDYVAHEEGRREVIPMKLLLQRRSSGCLHAMIDVCHPMMSFYLCLLMGTSIESQR